MMVSILFTWAKGNPEISYKQGMNELLGILMFVGYAEIPENVSGISKKASEVLNVLNSQEYLEADIYWCFARLMDLGISELFNPVVTHQSTQRKKQDLFTWDAEKMHNDLVNQDKSQEQNVSSILRRCHKVHHQLLQSIDREIFNHLEARKTEPQMYLQRWLRCMLSREFNLADTLELWDAIFANYYAEPEKGLSFLDFLCIAMIVFVREFCKEYIVLQSDQSGILRRLLKYPPVEDVNILVGMALKYKTKNIAPIKIVTKQEVTNLSSSPLFGQKKIMGNDKTPPRMFGLGQSQGGGNNNLSGSIDEAISVVRDIANE
jgi:TBC1 domain family protein 5